MNEEKKMTLTREEFLELQLNNKEFEVIRELNEKLFNRDQIAQQNSAELKKKIQEKYGVDIEKFSIDPVTYELKKRTDIPPEIPFKKNNEDNKK